MNSGSDIKLWIPLLAALVGGLMATFAQFCATRWNYAHNAKLAQQQKQNRINGLLVAIRNEFEVAGKIFQRKAGQFLEKVPAGQPYMMYASLTAQYFIVYPNNTDMVGQLNDETLCKAIIETYAAADYMTEGLRINNWYLDQYKEYNQLRAENLPSDYATKHFESTKKSLVDFVPDLKKAFAEFVERQETLLAQINSYLISHQDH